MSHSHGTTSSSSSSSMSSHDMMVPYLHFTGGDFLFFDTWQPSTPGAIFGACIGLVVLAVLERWLAATRAMFTAYWQHRASLITAARDQAIANHSATATDKAYLGKYDMLERQDPRKTGSSDANSKGLNKLMMNARMRTVAPFIAAHDIPRGILFALQMLISYILMLAVMTFQAAYIIAIVLGLAFGEVIFGRATGGAGGGH